MDGRPNRRNKAVFSISSDLKSVLKALFSRRISVDGRPNRRNKAVFSYSLDLNSVLKSSVFVTD